MTRRGFAALVPALALSIAVSACGGGDEDTVAREAEYAAAIATSLQAALGAEGIEVEDAPARCVGEQAVRILGVGAFEKAGVAPEEIRAAMTLDPISAALPTPEQAAKLAEGFFTCVDVGKTIVEFLRSELGSGGAQLPKETWSCIAESAQASPLLRELLAEQILAGGRPSLDISDAELAQEIFGDCLTLEELLELGRLAGG